MNDRCAAGTGRFLENIALAMGLTVDEFGRYALAADGKYARISSMCTVFAESEVVSLVGRGENSHQVALGIHKAIAGRIAAMVRRVGLCPRFVFAGGVAKNPCMIDLLNQEMEIPITIPENPQVIGALGAAIHAMKKYS